MNRRVEALHAMIGALADDEDRASVQTRTRLQKELAEAGSRGFHERARLPWGAPVYEGQCDGHTVRVAAYTEPSLFWERTHCLARSWNVMSDHTCLASLEDRASALTLAQVEQGAA